MQRESSVGPAKRPTIVTATGVEISQRQLLTEVWGPTYVKETHYLRQYMAQLRRKLEPNPRKPRYLKTLRGLGYRLDIPG